MTLASSNAVPRSNISAASASAVLARCSMGVLAGLLWLAATVFLWRRLAGALVEPLSLPVLLGVALAVGGTAVAARIAWRHHVESHRRRWLLEISASLAVLALAVAVSLPGTPIVGLIVLWAILGAEEVGAWWRHPRWIRPRPRPTAPAAAPVSAAAEPPTAAAETAEPEPASKQPELEEIPAGEVLQQLVRTAMPDGSERLTGWLRVPLAAGQRSANLHLAFCPPFAQTPHVTVDQRDGPSARIKPVQLLPFGARFDLKLVQPSDEPSAVVLHVRADSEPTIPEEPGGKAREDQSS